MPTSAIRQPRNVKLAVWLFGAACWWAFLRSVRSSVGLWAPCGSGLIVFLSIPLSPRLLGSFGGSVWLEFFYEFKSSPPFSAENSGLLFSIVA